MTEKTRRDVLKGVASTTVASGLAATGAAGKDGSGTTDIDMEEARRQVELKKELLSGYSKLSDVAGAVDKTGSEVTTKLGELGYLASGDTEGLLPDDRATDIADAEDVRVTTATLRNVIGVDEQTVSTLVSITKSIDSAEVTFISLPEADRSYAIVEDGEEEFVVDDFFDDPVISTSDCSTSTNCDYGSTQCDYFEIGGCRGHLHDKVTRKCCEFSGGCWVEDSWCDTDCCESTCGC